MLAHFVKRRSIWWPTWLGWLLVFLIGGTAVGSWSRFGEAFLSATDRRPAEVLIVEGWIGIEGARAAKTEFLNGRYSHIVTTGGLMNNRWTDERGNYATELARVLRTLGLTETQIIAAPASDTASHRTFEATLAVREALITRGLRPRAINVFTLGAHARRSRLVYSKAFPTGTDVGVVSWVPTDYRLEEPWWKSSERSVDFLKETVGYFFELLFNSGRFSNSPSS